jgi:large subunit ribosomal protein L9
MSIKVILTEEVPTLGVPGTIVAVAPGYARNFLVPRKLAVYADDSKLKELAHNQKRLERKRAKLQAAADATAGNIGGQTLTIDVRAGLDGKLFGSVTASDISIALKQQLNVEVDRRKVSLRESIRALGIHAVEVHLMGDTRATVNVHVVDSSHPFEAPVVIEAADATEPAPVVAAAPAVEETPEEA